MADNLTPGQRKVLREIQAAPSYKTASAKVRKALLEAVAVESNFSTPNQANSDRDSEGALQQRPSQGWGPTSESNTTDAEQFLQRAIPLAKKYGSAGALAQAVQRSAFPDRYNQRSGLADSLLGRGAGGGSEPRSGSARGRSAITVDIPTSEESTSFDQEAFDRAKKLSILGGYLKSKNPNNPLLRAGVLSDQAPNPSDFTKTETTVGSEKFTIPGTGSKGGSSAPSGGGLAATAKERADIIDAKKMRYLWGGGHGAKITDVRNATPLDCSGAVSAVLGINPRVSGGFEKWGRPGDGGNTGVTVYANSHHVLMKINGRFFGTSGTNPGGGAGWIPASALSKDYLKGFTVRHSNR